MTKELFDQIDSAYEGATSNEPNKLDQRVVFHTLLFNNWPAIRDELQAGFPQEA